ncbi:hypothetical protein L4D00_21855 [Photobacterium swingsii]|uniref:hypothetical protein n=1 Tax=Photobacterium swingsii TaxID=680026 RepID=UPI003D12AE42
MPRSTFPLSTLLAMYLLLSGVSFTQAADDSLTYCHSYAGINFPDYRALWNPVHPEQTEITYKALLNLATKSHDKTYLSELLSQIARTYTVRHQYSNAEYYLSQSALYLDDAQPSAHGHYWAEKARLKYFQHQQGEAISALDQAWKYAQKASDDRLQVEVAVMQSRYDEKQSDLWLKRAQAIIVSSDDLRLKKEGAVLL